MADFEQAIAMKVSGSWAKTGSRDELERLQRFAHPRAVGDRECGREYFSSAIL
jgi:hypothetical protein